MSKTLAALLFPFLNMFQVVEGGEAAPATEGEQKPQATEENVATDSASTAEQEVEKEPEKMVPQSDVDKAIQKRLAKEARKHERERMQLETELRYLRENAAANTRPADTNDIPKPKESDFEVYSDYLEALSDWKVDVKLRQREIEQETKAQRESQKSAQEREAARQQELIDNGEDKYDDFKEVVTSSKVDLSRAAYLAILESDISADLMYYVCSNEAEAKRLAALPAFAQAKEIGKLEDKLLAKPQKQISKAPAPINPIGTGKASGNALSDDLPIEEWMRRRQKQVRGA